MTPNILPTESLSQVVFIHDYMQLVFQGATFSIYNAAELNLDGAVYLEGSVGFCDSLVSLIGEPLISASAKPVLTLTFKNGAILVVGQVGSGPEAWQYCAINSPAVIEKNA